jgi:hypothetical protein
MLADIADQEYTVTGTKTGKELAHLVGARKARFIDEVEVLLLSQVWVRAADEEALQRSSLDACHIQLARGAGGRGEALNVVALPFCGAANNCERGCLPCAGEALETLDAVRRAEYIFDHPHLCPVEMRVLVGDGDGLGTRKNRFGMVLSVTHPAKNFVFRFDGFGGGELSPRNALWPVDDLKFPRKQAEVEVGADLGVGDLTHSPAEPVPDQRTFIDNRLALEVLVAGKGERFSNTVARVGGLLPMLGLMLSPFTRGPYNRLGLVSKGCRQLSVRGHDLSRRMDLLAVAR